MEENGQVCRYVIETTFHGLLCQRTSSLLWLKKRAPCKRNCWFTISGGQFQCQQKGTTSLHLMSLQNYCYLWGVEYSAKKMKGPLAHHKEEKRLVGLLHVHKSIYLSLHQNRSAAWLRNLKNEHDWTEWIWGSAGLRRDRSRDIAAKPWMTTSQLSFEKHLLKILM